MDATARAAAGAYQNLARLGDGLQGRSGGALGALSGGPGESFASALRDAVGAVAEQGRATEARTQAFANGRADLVDVVTAVAETEVALETMVSVRDRMIQAYEEIMRMPI
jgi:flagellar hook-basal body complex protein FliE